jgi:hypothetical protein
MLSCLSNPKTLYAEHRFLLRQCNKLPVFLLCSTILAVLPDQPILGQGLPTISGRTVDSSGNPVTGIAVKLWIEDSGLRRSQTSDSNGHFQIEHKPCKSCCLEVVPPKSTGLASALIERIPGTTSRKIIVELKQGFTVHGRVVNNGKGLKGLAVKVSEIPEEGGSNRYIHGGGTAMTNRDGLYSIILTPGPKLFVVLNNRYRQLAPRTDAKFTVTQDMTLQDVVLPEAK